VLRLLCRYVCNVVPSFAVKLTGPYWFHMVSYKYRMLIAVALMALSFIVVAIGGITDNLGLQLLGVIFGSTQSGFGEASYLALTAFYDSRVALTAWSSGTGCAGIFGYAWVIIFIEGFGASFQLTLFCALVIPVLFWANFLVCMNVPHIKREVQRNLSLDEPVVAFGLSADSASTMGNPIHGSTALSDSTGDCKRTGNTIVNAENTVNTVASNIYSTKQEGDSSEVDLSAAAAVMSMRERIQATLSLWPYMVPLFLVYFAEYAMQSGVWAAMGFPVHNSNARDKFYEYSNWMYQAGVLVSRSSGTVWRANMTSLWVMPFLQVTLLLFFVLDAYYMFWYDWSILIACFVVGLLGGAVYVNGFSLIAENVRPHLKEFSLSAASIADSVGIALSNVAGIFIQRALYDYHGLSD